MHYLFASVICTNTKIQFFFYLKNPFNNKQLLSKSSFFWDAKRTECDFVWFLQCRLQTGLVINVSGIRRIYLRPKRRQTCTQQKPQLRLRLQPHPTTPHTLTSTMPQAQVSGRPNGSPPDLSSRGLGAWGKVKEVVTFIKVEKKHKKMRICCCWCGEAVLLWGLLGVSGSTAVYKGEGSEKTNCHLFY